MRQAFTAFDHLCFDIHKEFFECLHDVASGFPRPHPGCDLVTTFRDMLVKGEGSPREYNVGVAKSYGRTEIVFTVADECNDVVFDAGLPAVLIKDVTLAHVSWTQAAPILPMVRRQLQAAGVIKR